MEPGKRHRNRKAWKIGNRVMIFVILSVICLGNIPPGPDTFDAALSDRLDLSASLIVRDRLFLSVVPVQALRKASTSLDGLPHGTITAFQFAVTVPPLVRMLVPPWATTISPLAVGCVNRVRAPPQGLLF